MNSSEVKEGKVMVDLAEYSRIRLGELGLWLEDIAFQLPSSIEEEVPWEPRFWKIYLGLNFVWCPSLKCGMQQNDY